MHIENRNLCVEDDNEKWNKTVSLHSAILVQKPIV